VEAVSYQRAVRHNVTCPRCGRRGYVTTGPCGTWIFCAAHEGIHVTSRALVRSSVRLIIACTSTVSACTHEEHVDRRDWIATARELHLAALVETRAAFGLGPDLTPLASDR